MSKECLRFVV